MCRWGCPTTNTTFMCKWCGTWFCRECLRGSFPGKMFQPLKCHVCNQKNCQGTKVDFLIREPNADETEKKGRKSSARGKGRSAPPSGKSNKKAKGKKGAKKTRGKKGGKKSVKKKRK